MTRGLMTGTPPALPLPRPVTTTRCPRTRWRTSGGRCGGSGRCGGGRCGGSGRYGGSGRRSGGL